MFWLSINTNLFDDRVARVQITQDSDEEFLYRTETRTSAAVLSSELSIISEDVRSSLLKAFYLPVIYFQQRV